MNKIVLVIIAAIVIVGSGCKREKPAPESQPQKQVADVKDLQQELEKAKAVPAPNPAIMRALDIAHDRPGDNNMVLHLWTGEAALIHELNVGRAALPAVRINRATATTSATERELSLDIAEIQNKIRQTARDLSACRQAAREAQFPCVQRQAQNDIQFDQDKLRELRLQLQQKKAELEKLSPPPAQP